MLNHSPAVTETAAATSRETAIGTGHPSSAASVLHQGWGISPVTSTGTVTTPPAAVTLSANSHFPPPLMRVARKSCAIPVPGFFSGRILNGSQAVYAGVHTTCRRETGHSFLWLSFKHRPDSNQLATPSLKQKRFDPILLTVWVFSPALLRRRFVFQPWAPRSRPL